MRLGDWLTAKKMTDADFATKVGVDRSTVGRWVDGSNMPRRRNMADIARVTDGQVTANDFVEGPTAIPEANAAA